LGGNIHGAPWRPQEFKKPFIRPMPYFFIIHDGDENIGFLPSKTPFECLRWEALVAFGDAARRIESFFKPPLAY
jgi:hypothetical protein